MVTARENRCRHRHLAFGVQAAGSARLV